MTRSSMNGNLPERTRAPRIEFRSLSSAHLLPSLSRVAADFLAVFFLGAFVGAPSDFCVEAFVVDSDFTVTERFAAKEDLVTGGAFVAGSACFSAGAVVFVETFAESFDGTSMGTLAWAVAWAFAEVAERGAEVPVAASRALSDGFLARPLALVDIVRVDNRGIRVYLEAQVRKMQRVRREREGQGVRVCAHVPSAGVWLYTESAFTSCVKRGFLARLLETMRDFRTFWENENRVKSKKVKEIREG